MLTIYTPKTTNRIKYIFDLVFREILGVPFQIINNVDEFKSKSTAKFSYDNNIIPDTLSFGAVYLLFEKGIKEQEIHVHEYEGLKTFFQLSKTEHCLPFDPFAASFYLVSRYEEYLPHVKDSFGRFPARESLAYKHGFLHIPLVNYYIGLIKKKIKERFPEISFSEGKFKYLPSYDIDSAYAYLSKGLMRNAGGLARSLLELDIPAFKDRARTLLNIKPDPFDTYEWMETLHQRYNLKPVFFFLVGDYGENDKNISIAVTEFQALIKSIADQSEVGIHPSFASNTDAGKLKTEIRNLSSVIKKEVRKSRQHFLKLEIPKTYVRLMENDITEDYSMGFASQLGFRASICHPFYFYNLENENKTTLRIFPFAVMDATLNYYLKVPPGEAMSTMIPYIDEVKKMKGVFISLWHNSSLSGEKEWTGWKQVYEDMVKYALNVRE